MPIEQLTQTARPDQSQKAFCHAGAGNVRLLAPAGCGKTLSLLFRCLALAERAYPQNVRFLLVTFTVAAKQELASRVNEETCFSPLRDVVDITTLNSWGYRRLRSRAFSPKLLTTKDDYHFTMRNLLQPIWAKHRFVKQAIEDKGHSAPREIMNLIDGFKSIGFDHTRHRTREQFSARMEEIRAHGLGLKLEELTEQLARSGVLKTAVDKAGEETAIAGESDVYKVFYRFWLEATKHLIASATFTLEDQKYVAYLDEREKLKDGKYLAGAARYDHVLVDEFQDINPLDLALLTAITDRNRATVTIVGDDDQALFEWRGATPEYILDPSRFFNREFETFTLAVNYRSPTNIVELSQKLIANNSRRVHKDTRAALTDNASIDIQTTADLNEAMERVFAEVQRSIGAGQSPSRIAIMGRKRSQIIPYQVFFAANNIPFCAAEDLQIFLSQAFDRLLSLVVIKTRCVMPQTRTQVVDDLLELCGLAKRYPLSKKDREALRRYLSQATPSTLSDAIEALEDYRGPLKGSNPDGRISADMAEAVWSFVNAETVAKTIDSLGDNFTGLKMDLGKAEDDIFFTDPPFMHLSEYAIRYGKDYARFIEDIELAKEQLVYVPPFEDEDKCFSSSELWKRPVHLMTALRAKGKEFDTVILLDVNDDIWPNKNAQTVAEKEAERRVFYVAFTRARKRVLMLVSERIGNKTAIPSQYIHELGL